MIVEMINYRPIVQLLWRKYCFVFKMMQNITIMTNLVIDDIDKCNQGSSPPSAGENNHYMIALLNSMSVGLFAVRFEPENGDNRIFIARKTCFSLEIRSNIIQKHYTFVDNNLKMLCNLMKS